MPIPAKGFGDCLGGCNTGAPGTPPRYSTRILRRKPCSLAWCRPRRAVCTVETGRSLKKRLSRALLSQLHPGRSGTLREEGLEDPRRGPEYPPALAVHGERGTFLGKTETEALMGEVTRSRKAQLREARIGELRRLVADAGLGLQEYGAAHARVFGPTVVDYWPGSGRAWRTGNYGTKAFLAEPARVVEIARGADAGR